MADTISLTTDFYPYGMPMLMGSCDTCHTPQTDTAILVPGTASLLRTWSNAPITPNSYPPQTATVRIANWALTTPQADWAQMEWQGTGSGMKLTTLHPVEPASFEAAITAATDTDPETEYTLHLTVEDNDMGVLLAKIIYYTDEEHLEYETLESAELTPGSNEISLNFTAPADSVWLMIGRPYDEGIDMEGSIMRITSATMYKYNWTVSPGYTGTLGLPIFNPYRFAYNGMERVDEKAGKANHYTAKFWEYDARKAIRENQDPKTDYGWSPYAVYGNNPILYNDPLGDYKTKFGAQVGNFLHGGDGVHQNKNKDSKSYGQWYYGKNENGRGRKGNGKNKLDVVIVKPYEHYGKNRVGDYLRTHDFYLNDEAKVTLGVQAGAGIDVANQKVEFEANAFSVELLSAKKEITGIDPTMSLDYIGKDYFMKFSQSGKIGIGFASAGVENEWRTGSGGGPTYDHVLKAEGGFSLKKPAGLSFNREYPMGGLSSAQPMLSTPTSKDVFTIGLSLKFLIGVEYKIEMGFKSNGKK